MASRSAVRGIRGDYWIIDALNAEWDQIAFEAQPLVRGWSGNSPRLAGCSSLKDVLEAMRADPDAVLSVLLNESATGEQLAGRVVLQAMLGKVVRMALCDNRARVDDYVAAMWCRIRTYPIKERPVKIAANLVLDTLKMVTRENQWNRHNVAVTSLAADEHLEEFLSLASTQDRLDHNAEISALSALKVIASAEELGLIDSLTGDVLLSVYHDGLSGKAAAVRHQTSVDMVRFRCSKAIRKLARHCQSVADAA